jgi:hypothetical protein
MSEAGDRKKKIKEVATQAKNKVSNLDWSDNNSSEEEKKRERLRQSKELIL